MIFHRRKYGTQTWKHLQPFVDQGLILHNEWIDDVYDDRPLRHANLGFALESVFRSSGPDYHDAIHGAAVAQAHIINSVRDTDSVMHQLKAVRNLSKMLHDSRYMTTGIDASIPCPTSPATHVHPHPQMMTVLHQLFGKRQQGRKYSVIKGFFTVVFANKDDATLFKLKL